MCRLSSLSNSDLLLASTPSNSQPVSLEPESIHDVILSNPILGLVDANESPEAAALRELHEETGYIVHKAKSISAISYNDVGITNTCSQVVHVEVRH